VLIRTSFFRIFAGPVLICDPPKDFDAKGERRLRKDETW